MHLCLFLSALRIMHAYVKCWGNDSAFVEPPRKGIVNFASSKCCNSSSCHASSIGTNSSLKITKSSCIPLTALESWREGHFTTFKTEGIMKINSLLPVKSCIMYFLFLEQIGTA